MAEFLTTSGTSYHIENIIIGANKKLVLVSPYLQISKTLLERLKDASNRGVAVKIIYGKNELNVNQKNALESLKNLELLFLENLHAKCYFNEKEMVITSMNMYEFSEKNNREMGVYITKELDKSLFEKAVAETLSIIQSSHYSPTQVSEMYVYEPTPTKMYSTPKTKKSKKGFCIRCEESIPYDTERPYCWDCYNIWYQFENPHYMENICHSCGDDEDTSMSRPECYECFVAKR